MRRLYLLHLCGDQCEWCGTKKDLEFDCKIPCGDAHHRMDTSHAMSFYWKQWLAGNLQLLCQKCNAKKGDDPQWT